MKNASLAIITPYYMAESKIEPLVDRIRKALHPLKSDWKLFIVDDRSPDTGWSKISTVATVEQEVIGIRLSKNFGQHSAITAGLVEAGNGFDYYVVMDCDLQDRPEDISILYREIGTMKKDMLIAKRSSHALGQRRLAGSYIFNKVLSWLSDSPVSSEVGNFRIFSRKVYEAYLQYGEQMRFFPLLMHKVGFNVDYIELPREERTGDSSSYTFWKLISLAANAFIAYSDKPLRFMASAGFVIFLISLVVGLVYLVGALLGSFSVPGFATITLLLIGFGGIQIFLISFIGLYVGQVLREAKHRPIYLVDEIIGK